MPVQSQFDRQIWNEEALAALPGDGYNVEVIDGRLVMSPENAPEHGELCARIFLSLGEYVRRCHLGAVWDSGTGFWMHNRNCRAPDISFPAKERLAGLSHPLTRFFEGAPDLAIELLSPSNTRDEMRSRLDDYFRSGTRLAWIVDPKRKIVVVYHSLEDTVQLSQNDVLDGENVAPGFRLLISELFTDWPW